MTSPAQTESNKRNAQRSTGPRSPEGRARAALNHWKHGRRSRRAKIVREQSYSFQERFYKWMSINGAQTDIDEFMTYRQVSLSFELDLADRARRDRANTLIENFDESEAGEIHEIGQRLLFDRAAAAPLYGKPVLSTKRRKTTSWDGQPVDRDNEPALLLLRLEATLQGCSWLAEQFRGLRDQLECVGFWQSYDIFKYIRLIGCQPVQANIDERVATVFVAGHALKPAGKTAFDALLGDVPQSQLALYRRDVKERWPHLYKPRENHDWKQILFDMVDENLDRLAGLIEAHEQNADETAERIVSRLQVDASPEGRLLRDYQLKCSDRFFRATEAIRKHKARGYREDRDTDRSVWNEPRPHSPFCGARDRPLDSARNNPPDESREWPPDDTGETVSTLVPEGPADSCVDSESACSGLMPDGDLRDGTNPAVIPAAAEDDPRIKCNPVPLPERVDDLDDLRSPAETQITTREIDEAVASPTSENSTIEPSSAGTLAGSDLQEPVHVTANSPALDKVAIQPREAGIAEEEEAPPRGQDFAGKPGALSADASNTDWPPAPEESPARCAAPMMADAGIDRSSEPVSAVDNRKPKAENVATRSARTKPDEKTPQKSPGLPLEFPGALIDVFPKEFWQVIKRKETPKLVDAALKKGCRSFDEVLQFVLAPP
jgi:hypothetical protein